jgi:small subunit ribosomal protein S1
MSDDDFATLFEASMKVRRFARGQMVEGRVVALGPEVALIDVGAKGEAQIDIAELKDEDGDVEVSVGDTIQALVVSTNGGLVLTRKGVSNTATLRQIEDAFQAGLPVEGRVEKAVKGGYDVRIARQRAFCPFSQIDISRTDDPAVHEGRTYSFRIIEFKNGGKDLVVSRRALLEQEQAAQAVALRQTLVPGAVITGRVVSVRDFGAFVDLGAGIQGLLHVSEMGWSRVTSPGEIVAAGDTITVKVLRVDEATRKVSLGLKQLLDDPWIGVASRFEAGQLHQGRVTRLADFGAFVELAPGVEGLAHVSTFTASGRADAWKQAVGIGTTGTFEIVSLDLVQKRIGLSYVEPGSVRSPEVREYAEPADAAAPQNFGTLADKLRGALDTRPKS